MIKVCEGMLLDHHLQESDRVDNVLDRLQKADGIVRESFRR